jgi:hypothetical protein
MAEPRNFTDTEIEFIGHRYFGRLFRFCGGFMGQSHAVPEYSSAPRVCFKFSIRVFSTPALKAQLFLNNFAE